jgi:signal transduction histidine kinase
MLEPLRSIVSSVGFEPHGHCFLWTPGLLWLYVVSDSVIALSYYAIPLALILFVRKRPDVAFRGIFLMFGAFILACGTTHLMGVWTIWEPTYWLDGGIKAATAALSLATAIVVFPLIPKAAALPSPALLEAANRDLQREIADRKLAQEALEEKTRALEAAQEELVRGERLAILGQLAGSVSHELRNPLGVIKNSVYYLNLVLPEDERVRRHLAILDRQVATATGIISGMLDFARSTPPARAPTDVNTLVRDGLDRLLSPATIRVVRDLAEELRPVMVDADQLRVVLDNLLSNAVQAMPDGGVLTMRTRGQDGRVEISVEDTGPGIAPDHLKRIFEPLFTTKSTGIGLGLSLAKRLTEANGGVLRVESAPSSGARFTITLGGAPA